MKFAAPNFPWKVLLVGLILISIRFYPALFQNKTTIFGDNYSLHVPERVFTGYWLKRGIIPWWNPTVFAGIPWTQEISQTVFYPTTILFTFLHPGTAISITIAIHLLFTYFGMFFLLKIWTRQDAPSLIGAVLWTFSTQVTGSSNNLVTIQSIAWFPWISYWSLRLFENRRIPLILSIFLLGQFLGGYPQHVVYAIFLAVMLSVVASWKKMTWYAWFLRWFITGVITIGVCAIAWVPFIEIFLHSTRVIQTTSQAGAGSLHPLMLIKIVLPYFFDNPAAGMKWGPAWSGFPNVLFYFTWLGALLLINAIKNRRNTTLIIFSVVTILIALGDNFFLFSTLQKLIPFFKVSRGPSIILVCTNIALCLVIAHELASIKKYHVKNYQLGLITLISIVSILGVWILPIFFKPMWNQLDVLMHYRLSSGLFHTIDRDLLLLQNVLNNILFNSGMLLVVLISVRYKKMKLAAVLLGIDMIFNTQGMLFFGPKDIYPSWKEINNSISALTPALKDPNYRLLTRNMNEPYTDYGMYWEALTVRSPFSDSFIDRRELETYTYLGQIRDSYTPDWNMVYQISTIHGYTTLLPKDFMELWQASSEPRINSIDRIDLQNTLLQKWAVGNYIVDKQFEIRESLPDSIPASLSATVDLYSLPALPRFRFEDNSPVDISTLKETPNTIELIIDDSNHKSLIIADRYDDNWKAVINGKKTSLNNFNGMRELDIHSGVNRIQLRFVPIWFYRGLVISVISLAGTIMIILFNRKKMLYR